LCESQYYAKDVPNSCDGFCAGEVFDNGVERYCRSNTTYYVGVILDDYVKTGVQIHIAFAMELINNKTDGWFDVEAAQVTLKMTLNFTHCDESQVISVFEDQVAWAAEFNNGQMIDGIIGAEVIYYDF
jgi:hypothetical protein